MNKVFSLLVTGAAVFGAATLFAQGGAAPAPSDSAPATMADLNALKKDLRAKVESKAGLSTKIGGTVELEYKQVEENTRTGTFRAPNRGASGFDLDKATLTADFVYTDSRSDYQPFAVGKVEFEFNETSALLDEAYVLFNNPITRRVKIPTGAGEFIRDNMTDSLLFGLEDSFWRNENRFSETYSLVDNAFSRDERLQALWTVTAFDIFYASVGVSNGTTLSLGGSIDETSNYQILQDDRGAHFAGVNNKSTVTKHMEFMAGLGFVLAFDEGKTFDEGKPFRGNDNVRKNALHVQGWYTNDKASDDERALVGTAFGRVSTDDSKWRFGANASFNYEVADNIHLYIRGDYVHAEDSQLRRDGWNVEGAIAIKELDLPLIIGITPFVRYGELLNNVGNRGPALGAGATGATVSGGLIGGERSQLNFGAVLAFHKSIDASVEYVVNGEDFEAPASGSSQVDNDAFVFSLRFKW